MNKNTNISSNTTNFTQKIETDCTHREPTASDIINMAAVYLNEDKMKIEYMTNPNAFFKKGVCFLNPKIEYRETGYSELTLRAVIPLSYGDTIPNLFADITHPLHNPSIITKDMLKQFVKENYWVITLTDEDNDKFEEFYNYLVSGNYSIEKNYHRKKRKIYDPLHDNIEIIPSDENQRDNNFISSMAYLKFGRDILQDKEHIPYSVISATTPKKDLKSNNVKLRRDGSSGLYCPIKKRELSMLEVKEQFYRNFDIDDLLNKYLPKFREIKALHQESKDNALFGKDKNRLTINVPPRTYKSTIISVIWPTWILGHDSSRKIIGISARKNLATRFAKRSREIMNSAWYKEIFPETKLKSGFNRGEHYETINDGQRLSVRSGENILGNGADYILFDDPNEIKRIHNKKYVNDLYDWFATDVITRLNDPKNGKVVISMHRIAHTDLTGSILQRDHDHLWQHVCTNIFSDLTYDDDLLEKYYDDYEMVKFGDNVSVAPEVRHEKYMQVKEVINELEDYINNRSDNCLEHNNKNSCNYHIVEKETFAVHMHFNTATSKTLYEVLSTEILDRKRFPNKELAIIKDQMGQERFDAMFKQNVNENEGVIIPASLITSFNYNALMDDVRNGIYPVCLSLDTASTDSGGSYSVCTVWAIIGNQYFMIDMFREQLSYPELKDKFVEFFNKYHRYQSKSTIFEGQPDVIIEDKASGRQLIQEFKGAIRIIEKNPGKYGCKEERLRAVKYMFENGRVLFPNLSLPLLNIAYSNIGHTDTDGKSSITNAQKLQTPHDDIVANGESGVNMPNNNFESMHNKYDIKENNNLKNLMKLGIEELTSFPKSRNSDVVDSVVWMLLHAHEFNYVYYEDEWIKNKENERRIQENNQRMLDSLWRY